MAIPDKITLWPQNSQILQLLSLQHVDPGSDPTTLSSVVAALVKVTLYDGEGIQVPGLINVTLSSIGSPPAGDYAGQIGPGFNPQPGGDYMLYVDGQDGSNLLHLEIPVEIKSRRQ